MTNKNGTLDASTLLAIQDCNNDAANSKPYTKYIILGGEKAVSKAVEAQLEGIGLGGTKAISQDLMDYLVQNTKPYATPDGASGVNALYAAANIN